MADKKMNGTLVSKVLYEELREYLKNKDKTTLVTMILWYAVALLGLITIIVN
mgnify:CR=1 FL=1